MLTEGRHARRFGDERGVTVVLFALILPVVLGLSAIVLAVGNWYTHARNLQTKVDAGALAGGTAWNLPCGDPTTGVSAAIVQQARTYVGPHIRADGTPSPYNAGAYNPQVGNPAPASKIHVVLNGNGYWTDSSSPADYSGFNTASTGLCGSMLLDVKATEDNTSLIGSIFPFFPDIKRSARIQIEQVTSLNGLLPIAVRVPQPVSAAAVWFDESNRNILSAKYLCKTTPPNGTPPNWVPAGLNGWTTYQSTNWDPDDPNCSTPASVPNLAATTGVAIVTSFTPACGTGSPPAAPPKCLTLSGFGTVNDLCRQANGNVAQCYYTDPSTLGNTQNVLSGLQFIHSYDGSGNVADGPPQLRGAWLTPSGCTGGAPFNGYFASIPTGNCSAAFTANVDIGTAPGRTASNTEIKYGLIYGDTVPQGNACLDGQNRPNCDMAPVSGAPLASATVLVPFNALSFRNSLVLRVRLRNTKIGSGAGATDCGNSYSATCQWFFTSGSVGTSNWPNNAATLANAFNNPVQRAFMGDLSSSGSVKYLSLNTDAGAGASCGPAYMPDGQAASVASNAQHKCFYMNVALAGGLAKAQSDPPIQLNIGVTSQSSVLDCDPNISNLKSEVVSGCQTPFYAPNSFTEPGGEFCPGPNYGGESVGQFWNTPKASPFDNWPPFTCVLTQTSNSANQIEQGLNARIFPSGGGCPADNASSWVFGRNYWSDANNLNDDYTFGSKNGFNKKDPRQVDLFFTPFNSFTGNGNEEFPVVGFGTFYITGWGRFNGNGAGATLQNDDPCPGSAPPADIIPSNGTVVWGHFVKQIAASANSTPSGVKCKEFDFLPCIPVLVK